MDNNNKIIMKRHPLCLNVNNNKHSEYIINLKNSSINTIKQELISEITNKILNLKPLNVSESGITNKDLNKELRFKSPGSSIWNHHYDCISLYNGGHDPFSDDELNHIGELIKDYFKKTNNIILNLSLTTESVN